MADRVQVMEVELEKLMISPLNVRKNVGDISELVDSIRAEGILQPLLVRLTADMYEIVVGSRRFTAAREAGLEVVPVVVRRLTDDQVVAISLTENLQRGELSLEERVEAYQKLQQLNPTEFGSTRALAKVIGRQHLKITQDIEAYNAMSRLRPHGIQVIAQLPRAAAERQRGEALPERHATILQQTFASVRALGTLDPDQADAKYVQLAQEIAPLDHEDARKVLDYFKMYPERPVEQLKGMALSKVDREVSLDPATARRLDELAQTAGKKWDEVITSLVDTARQPTSLHPSQLSFPLPTEDEATEQAPVLTPLPPSTKDAVSEQVPLISPSRPETVELPEEPLSEQIIGKTLWNVEQAERAGVQWNFYTIGYSQKTIQQFIAVLQSRHVTTLVDVRHDPVSMYKPDFSKENLRRALEGANIAYVHLPDLGVPKDLRTRLAKTADYDAFFGWYDATVVPRLQDGLMGRLQSAFEWPVAFMCVEQNPTKCHRHRIALALGEMGLHGADL